MIREKCMKENVENRSSYSNPAKLMNFIRMQKKSSTGSSNHSSSSFKDVNNYVTHIEAYS
jgi:hypothetical protein